MRCIFFPLVLLSYFLSQISADSLLVETSTGPIQGVQIPGKCREANAWYGIPFAKPPVKDLRYKRPIPIGPWSDVLQADTKAKGCHQIIGKSSYPGLYIPLQNVSEDCLYLNVVTPTKFDAPLPVMVWIHGGSYTAGATSMHLYDSECLSNIGGVVTVTIAYRVANLGFLYLDEDTAPGNLALLDQQLALKWVKENIQAFGGDPDRITIHGQSAGGSSVSFHLLAEGSKDLFKYVIVQSGASNAPWSWISNESARERTKNFATRVGCTDTSNHETLLICLQEVDAQKLVESEEHPDVPQFPPTLDGLFVKEDPWTLLSKTDFTGRHVMIGTTSDEGDIYAFNYLKTTGTDPNQIPYNVSANDAKVVLKMANEILSSDLPEEVTNAMFDFYSQKTNKNYFKVVSNGVFGDPFLNCPVNDFADGLARNGAQIYKYVFSHVTKNSPWGKRGLKAAHCEELLYMFGEPFKKDAKMEFTLFEKRLSIRTIRYWTNFARTGELRRNLLQPWPLYDEKDKKYIDICLIGTSVKQNFRGEFCDFFKKLIN